MEQTRSLRGAIDARRHIHDYAQTLSAGCGHSAPALELDILRAKRQNHISLDEYAWTGYYDRSAAQKRSVSTLWTRAEFRKTFTDRRYIGLLMNKYIFSKTFSEFYGRRCIPAQEATAAALETLAGDQRRVVFKPNCKGSGVGVRVLPAGGGAEISAALDFLRKAGGGIVEEYIVQHETLARLNPGAVSIVRFYSVSAPSGLYLFAPVLTTAARREISNGCQDALTAVADIRTGVVLTDAVDQNALVDYPAHPVTGVRFQGLRLPYWQETLALMRRAVPLAEKISNIGWDVAITPTGPLIVEANTIPGFNTAQYRGFAWVTDGFGYQPLFDEAFGRAPFADPARRYARTVLRLRGGKER